MKSAEGKKTTLLAHRGELNRPLRVRPVRYMGREWWAIEPDDVWPGMVMDLRRLGFEAVALADEVLVREGAPAYELQMDGPAASDGLRPFPVVHPTISIGRDSRSVRYRQRDEYEYEDYDAMDEDVEEEWLAEDLDADEE